MRQIFRNPRFEEEFDRSGFVILPFLDSEKIDFFRNFYQNEHPDTSGFQFHSTMFSKDPLYRKKVDATIKENTKNLTENYLINFEPLFANFIVKEPGEESSVGLHQDWNFVDEKKFISLNYWCPLVDITEETGLFYVLKGSEKIFKEVRTSPHHYIFSGLEDIIFKYAEPLSVKAGQAIFYHNAIVHFSKPNLSNSIRLALGSALIPKEAQALHYYMDLNQPEKKIEIYPADCNFFVNYEIGKRPQGYQALAIYDYKPIEVTREHLEGQLRKAKQLQK